LPVSVIIDDLLENLIFQKARLQSKTDAALTL